MKPVWYPYTLWEDYQNGMYDEVKEGRGERVKRAAEILSDEKLCFSLMTLVTEKWEYATAQNLTNKMYNHRPYLGQTACNIVDGVKEDETREAWGIMTELQRQRANHIADVVRDSWIEKHRKDFGDYQVSIFDL